MKFSTLYLPLILVSACALSGCARGPSPTGLGLFTDVSGPVTATALSGSKTGTACAKSILGLVNNGDASIAAAKKAGDISTVASVDYHSSGVYPFYGKTCLIVTGN
jgi:hypothetical protein